MKQYRITTENLINPEPNDCYLAPDDPVHELILASQLGGLGADARIHQHRSQNSILVSGSDKGKIQREQNIKPGTEEWFKLWFGKE